MSPFRTFATMIKVGTIFMICLFFFSCKDKKTDDIQAPVIESVLIDGVESTSATRVSGQSFRLEVNLSDNEALNQVQINVHPANNGHTHDGDGQTGGEDRLNVGDWGKNEIQNISGTSLKQSWDIQIPDSIGGKWHIIVTLLDEAGLTSRPFVVLLEVTNPNLPIVSGVTSPLADSGGTVHISFGANISLSGEVSDWDGIKRFFVHLDNYAGVSGDTLEIPITGNGYALSFPSTSFHPTSIGTYRIVIEAKDSLGFKGKWDAKIDVN